MLLNLGRTKSALLLIKEAKSFYCIWQIESLIMTGIGLQVATILIYPIRF